MATTSMMLIPCVHGISHNEVGKIEPEVSIVGGDFALRVILEKVDYVA